MQSLPQWNPKLEHARFDAYGISPSALSLAASRAGSITTACPYMGNEKLDTLNQRADSLRLIQVKQFDFQ